MAIIIVVIICIFICFCAISGVVMRLVIHSVDFFGVLPDKQVKVSHSGVATHKKRLMWAKPRNHGLGILVCRRALRQGITENLEECKKSSGLKIEKGGEKKCKSER